jgi:hypothetical protein
MAPYTTLGGFPVIFSTSDFYGNTVTLYQTTWDGHIATEHAEMAGLEEFVEAAVVDPVEINPSTRFPDSLAFRFEINRPAISINEIRVLVWYDSLDFLTGGTNGTVTTTYPIDLSQYNPALAAAIYTKQKK